MANLWQHFCRKETAHSYRRESVDLWRRTNILLKLFLCQSFISTLDSWVFYQADVRYWHECGLMLFAWCHAMARLSPAKGCSHPSKAHLGWSESLFANDSWCVSQLKPAFLCFLNHIERDSRHGCCWIRCKKEVSMVTAQTPGPCPMWLAGSNLLTGGSFLPGTCVGVYASQKISFTTWAFMWRCCCEGLLS